MTMYKYQSNHCFDTYLLLLTPSEWKMGVQFFGTPYIVSIILGDKPPKTVMNWLFTKCLSFGAAVPTTFSNEGAEPNVACKMCRCTMPCHIRMNTDEFTVLHIDLQYRTKTTYKWIILQLFEAKRAIFWSADQLELSRSKHLRTGVNARTIPTNCL